DANGAVHPARPAYLAPPEPGAEAAAAIKREGGHEVEHRQCDVYEHQRCENAGHKRWEGEEGQHEHDRGDGQARERSDPGAERCGPRALGLSIELGDAAEEPQRDAGDLDAVTRRNQGVPRLVRAEATMASDVTRRPRD